MPRFETLNEIFIHATRSYSHAPLFGVKRSGRWEWITYTDFEDATNRLRAGLASLGVGRGDRVAILANNRPEWAMAAYASFGLGAAIVPMYEAQHEAEWHFILEDSRAKVLVVATDAIAVKTMSALGATGLEHLVSMEASSGAGDGRVRSFASLVASSSRVPLAPIVSADTACVLYTSGTTGSPKGVELSHGNIASNVSALGAIFPLEATDRSLSFLPWAHAFGQIAELHTLFSMGASMALAESADRIPKNLAETTPTMLVSVPRIFNKLFVQVRKQLAMRPKVIQSMVDTAVAARTRQRGGEVLSWTERLSILMSERLVFAKVRAQLGGRLRMVVSGGAALSLEVAEFIDSLGIPVYEGYGLTETSPVVATNLPTQRRLGSVGKVIPGSEVRIADDGEIVVYGPNVMQGYYRNAKATELAFTKDGGFRTGDLGRLDRDGFLFVTGRLKEQYKLENGKYVVPTPLEEQLKLSPYVLNIMVHGDNRPYNVALIVANVPAVREWAEAKGIVATDPEALLARPEIHALVEGELRERSETFKRFELVNRFALLTEDFTTANGLLTPSLKVKRRSVLERYGVVVESLYGPTSPAGLAKAAIR